MLVVGYPLALVAFAAWRGVGGAGAGRRRRGGPGARGLEIVGDRAGETVCREVYGRAYHKLLVNLRALHPALEHLVLVDAYGKVIGRPGPRPQAAGALYRGGDGGCSAPPTSCTRTCGAR